MHWIEALSNKFLVVVIELMFITLEEFQDRKQSWLAWTPLNHLSKSKQNGKISSVLGKVQSLFAMELSSLLVHTVILCPMETTYWSPVNLKKFDLESAKFNICAVCCHLYGEQRQFHVQMGKGLPKQKDLHDEHHGIEVNNLGKK